MKNLSRLIALASFSLPLVCNAQFISNGSTYRWVSASGLTNYLLSTTNTGLYTDGTIDTGSWGYALSQQSTIVAENSIHGSCYANVSSNGTNAIGGFSYIDGYAASQLSTTFTIAKDTPYALFGANVYNGNGKSYSFYNGWGAGGIRRAGTATDCDCYIETIPYPLGSTDFSTSGVLHPGSYIFNVDAGDLALVGYHDEYAEYNWDIVFTFATVPNVSTSFVTNSLILQWPTVFTNFVLEATSDASLVGAWRSVTNDVTVQGDLSSVVVDTSSPARFFRMRHL